VQIQRDELFLFFAEMFAGNRPVAHADLLTGFKIINSGKNGAKFA